MKNLIEELRRKHESYQDEISEFYNVDSIRKIKHLSEKGRADYLHEMLMRATAIGYNTAINNMKINALELKEIEFDGEEGYKLKED